MLRSVFLGPPGSGKGSQAKFVVESYGVAHISTGELLRDAVLNKTRIGMQVSELIEQGSLAPDKIVLQLISDHLEILELSQGFLLDGFPRSLPQAEMLDKILAKHKVPLMLVLHLQIDHQAVVKRLSGRRNCPNCGRIYNVHFDPPKVPGQCDDCRENGVLVHRADDNEESIKHRLKVYDSQTKPLLNYYQDAGLLQTVDASGPPELIAETVAIVIERILSSQLESR